MTWLTTFFLRAFVVLLQVARIYSDENGPLPGFKQQPANTIIRSANQTILCDVKGEKPLKITWLKNEQILDLKNYLTISTEGSLNIFNTNRKRDEGSYRCVVENKYGRVLSTSAKLTFPYMNDFTRQDSRVTVNEGERAYLACHAPDSYPDRNIYWSKLKSSGSFPLQLERNSHFTTSESGDLFFSYTDNSDYGVYYCSVENNNFRRLLKRTVVLAIKPQSQKNMAPQVWQFNDKIAMKDSNFMIECISYGRPIPTMKFRHKKTGTVLKGSVQTGNRLRHLFAKFEKQHEGEYACDLVNAFGQTASRNAYVKMEAKPELVTKSRSISLAIDSTNTLACVATGIPNVNYVWFYNGNVLSANAEIKFHKGNLTIPKIMRHHGGFYQCIAVNKHGEDIMTIHIKVVENAPTFEHNSVRPAKNTHALVGGSAEINCIPHGAPKPTIQWRKKNSSIDVVSQDQRFTVLPTGTLKITNIKKTDQGIYECIAQNKLGTAMEEGNLIISGGLAITEPLSKEDWIITGQKMTLKCTISSSEKMEIVFRWYIGSTHNKRPLLNRGRVKIRRLNLRQSLLEIDKVTDRDYGFYTCEARGTKNRSDYRTQLIIVSGGRGPRVISSGPPGIKTTAVPYKESTKLTLLGPPEPPLDVEVEDINGISIKIKWTMSRDNGSPATRCYIQARTTFDLDNWETIAISNVTLKPRQTEIVHLSPWVEYKIRVIAENKHGKSKPSVETEKWSRTPTAKPRKYPEQIMGNGTGPNELVISFQPLDEMDQNAPGIQYIVYHRVKGSRNPMVSDVVGKGQNSIKLTFQATDSFFKPYEFQVQAQNNQGYGPKSPVYTAYTGERSPIIVPVGLHVRITSPSSAVASWDPVSTTRNTMRGSFIGYKFLYWVRPKAGYPRLEQYVSSQSTTVKVKLTPYTDYYFQVLAFNGAGDGPGSKVYGPLQTPEGQPSPPQHFRITDASEGQAALSWNEPLHKNGILTQYILTYQSLPSGHISEKELATDETFLLLTNLEPNAKYAFKLAAVTIAGMGEQAKVIFDFSKVPSIKPEVPRIGSIGHNAVVLTWRPVSSESISGYKVFYWKSGEIDAKAIALWERNDDIVTTVQHLDSDSTYYFQIAVVNKYGTGPRSKTVEAHTKVNKNATPKPTPLRIKDKPSSSTKLTFTNYIILVFTLIAVLVPR